MEENKYYLCIEYKKKENHQYGKCYISFNENGSLIYDSLYKYTLKDIDIFLEHHSKEQIINQMRDDNAIYFLDNKVSLNDIELSIRYFDKGKERIEMMMQQECLKFDLEYFMNQDWNDFQKKQIYNNLSGYMNNSRTSEKMKTWIKVLRTETSENLMAQFQKLSYMEQRKIKSIIYTIIKPSNVDKELIDDKEALEIGYTRKKTLDLDKVA